MVQTMISVTWRLVSISVERVMQSLKDVEFTPSVLVPSGHNTQLESPGSGVNCPTGQAKQTMVVALVVLVLLVVLEV